MILVGRLRERVRGRAATVEQATEAERVSVVSHELRSPMAALVGAARVLQERWPEIPPEQRSSLLSLIVDETERLATLVEDLLDTSRIDAGTFPYTFAEVDLGGLVRDTAAMLRLGQGEVGVVVRGADSLPRVRGDRSRLKQVLVNLIENAVEHSQAGDEVEVEVCSEAGRVLVAVRDRGPGIPREQHGVIFEKFGRADAASGRSGTGLGLFIARSIAEAHQGRVDVRSDPGRGATFTLDLPVA